MGTSARRAWKAEVRRAVAWWKRVVPGRWTRPNSEPRVRTVGGFAGRCLGLVSQVTAWNIAPQRPPLRRVCNDAADHRSGPTQATPVGVYEACTSGLKNPTSPITEDKNVGVLWVAGRGRPRRARLPQQTPTTAGMHRAWPGLDFGALCGAHSDELELKMAATPGSHPGGPGSADAARPLPSGADTRIIPPDGGGWACGDFRGAERFVWSDVAGGEVGVGEGPARPGSPAADSPERPRQVWGAGRGVNWGVTDGLEAEPAPDLRGNEVQPGRRGASVADPGGLARRRRAQELPDGKLNLDEAAKLRALRNQMEEYEVKIKDFTKEYTRCTWICKSISGELCCAHARQMIVLSANIVVLQRR